MKILKYISLLLLLVLVASSILIATLDPNYSVTRTREIKASKIEIFNYVNNYKNWSEFASWHKKDKTTKYKFSSKTIGIGSSYSWIGSNDEGNIKTIFVKNNDSIYQKMNFNDSESKVYWSFKEKNGITKVTWQNVGKMDFLTKIFTTFSRGMTRKIGGMYDKSLVNLEKNLQSQTNTFSIKIDGFQEKNIGYYLQKTINSTNENLESNIQIMIPNLLKFVKNNKINLNGKPFVKYNGKNDSLQITNFSVCVPIKDSLMISPQSEINFRTFLPFQTMKATLTGDYSHKNDAIAQINQLIISSKLIQNPDLPVVEFYNKSKFEEKNPSKWVTEIYIPVKTKTATKKYFKPKKIVADSTGVN